MNILYARTNTKRYSELNSLIYKTELACRYCWRRS